MTKTVKAITRDNPKQNPHAINRSLEMSEKVALASASLAIQRLPDCLQQASNAFDMQAMLVDPSSVWRAGYILRQATEIFASYSGWSLQSLNKGDLSPLFKADMEKLIADAIVAHQAEIMAEAAWDASPDGRAFSAEFEKRFDAFALKTIN